MIIPATTIQLLTYISKKGELKNEPQDGFMALARNDRGEEIVVQFTSNKKNISLNDFKEVIKAKEASLLKAKEIKTIASDIEYTEDFDEQYQVALSNSDIDKKDKKALMEFKKVFKIKMATDLVLKKIKVGPKCLFRVALSYNEEKPYFINIGKAKLKVYQSRAILFDNEGLPAKSGLGIFAQRENALPISIRKVKNKDFWTVHTTYHANLDQILFLIGHFARTAKKLQEKGSKRLYPTSIFCKNKTSVEIKQIQVKLKELGEQDKQEQMNINDYLTTLRKLYIYLKNNPKQIKQISLRLNLMLSTQEVFNIVYGDKENPVTLLPKIVVNLNLRGVNPENKKNAENSIENEIKKCEEILAIYHFPSVGIEESNTWGFMEQNIQRGSCIMPIDFIENKVQQLLR